MYGGACLILVWAMRFEKNALFLFLLPLVLFSWRRSIAKHVNRTLLSAIKEIRYFPHLDIWLIHTCNGASFLAHLCRDSMLVSGMAILRFKRKTKSRGKIHYLIEAGIPCLISLDAVNRAQFRYLRKFWRQDAK